MYPVISMACLVSRRFPWRGPFCSPMPPAKRCSGSDATSAGRHDFSRLESSLETLPIDL